MAVYMLIPMYGILMMASFLQTQIPPILFLSQGDHTVVMSAFGLSGSDTTEQIVSVHERPQAIFDAYPLEAKNLKRTSSSSTIRSMAATTSGILVTEQLHQHESQSRIRSSGLYTITLYAWSENNCLDTLIHEYIIHVISR